MLYTDTSIELLISRIGWDQVVPPSALVVDADNLISESGRFFNSFHQLVTAENVNDCVINLKITVADLNVYLAKMKKDSVLEVLHKLFDTNDLANYPSNQEAQSLNYSADGYDGLIEKFPTVFDQSIGYCMAVRALQLFITSERSNGTQRKMRSSYDYLKTELEGVRNPEGLIIAKGANTLFTLAVEDAGAILFPIKTIETKKTLTARSYW